MSRHGFVYPEPGKTFGRSISLANQLGATQTVETPVECAEAGWFQAVLSRLACGSLFSGSFFAIAAGVEAYIWIFQTFTLGRIVTIFWGLGLVTLFLSFGRISFPHAATPLPSDRVHMHHPLGAALKFDSGMSPALEKAAEGMVAALGTMLLTAPASLALESLGPPFSWVPAATESILNYFGLIPVVVGLFLLYGGVIMMRGMRDIGDVYDSALIGDSGWFFAAVFVVAALSFLLQGSAEFLASAAAVGTFTSAPVSSALLQIAGTAQVLVAWYGYAAPLLMPVTLFGGFLISQELPAVRKYDKECEAPLSEIQDKIWEEDPGRKRLIAKVRAGRCTKQDILTFHQNMGANYDGYGRHFGDLEDEEVRMPEIQTPQPECPVETEPAPITNARRVMWATIDGRGWAI